MLFRSGGNKGVEEGEVGRVFYVVLIAFSHHCVFVGKAKILMSYKTTKNWSLVQAELLDQTPIRNSQTRLRDVLYSFIYTSGCYTDAIFSYVGVLCC